LRDKNKLFTGKINLELTRRFTKSCLVLSVAFVGSTYTDVDLGKERRRLLKCGYEEEWRGSAIQIVTNKEV